MKVNGSLFRSSEVGGESPPTVKNFFVFALLSRAFFSVAGTQSVPRAHVVCYSTPTPVVMQKSTVRKEKL